MIRSLRSWKKRLAPPLCALLAAGGAAWADDMAPSAVVPGELSVNEATAIAPAAHTGSEDDPPAPPSFPSAPSSRAVGRRGGTYVPPPPVAATADIVLPEEHASETPGKAAPPVTLAAPTLPDARPPAPVEDEPLTPVPLPDDVELNAHGLSTGQPARSGLGDGPDVHIAAPLPAEVPQTEMVEERYPNGSLHIAREVTQDSQGNFINHGSWKEWNQRGELIAEGQYKRGVRDGVWRRLLQAKDSQLFTTPPYNQYQPPFVSEVKLKDGRLDGSWIITDGRGQKVSEIEFVGGQRHGMASWWHANGKKMQQITFKSGVADGDILTWRSDGSLAAKEVYLEGRKVEAKTEYHAKDRRKSSGEYLLPRMVVVKEDDWWNARLATFSAQGKPDRHGAWTSWHQNGQEQVEGHFEYGLPHGEFVWWYANGQKNCEGGFRNGERHGVWTWWHENGLKSSMGNFIDGKPAGDWTWWAEDGKVAQKADFADGVPQQALENARKSLQTTLPIQKPRR